MYTVTVKTQKRKQLALPKGVRKGLLKKVVLSRVHVSTIAIDIIIIIIIKTYNPEVYKHGKSCKLIVIKLVFLTYRAVS